MLTRARNHAGWQSYPMLETYAAAMDPANDWGVGNPMNEFRNRRTDVTPEFLSQYARHFKLPKDWNPADTSERLTRFKSYLWIGHMQHARCYETALNLWRRLRSHAKCARAVMGTGRCMQAAVRACTC